MNKPIPADTSDPAERIAELEDTLRQRDAKIKELTAERDEAQILVGQMSEHAEAHDETIKRWIEVFHLEQDEHGIWVYDRYEDELWRDYDKIIAENRQLTREWNRFVPQYNSRINPRQRLREPGRPLGASPAQEADVLKRRKAGASLRAIADVTSLSLRTVRTIVEKAAGQDRTSKRTIALRRREFDRLRAARYRARKAARDGLPKAINGQLKTGAALAKAVKGL